MSGTGRAAVLKSAMLLREVRAMLLRVRYAKSGTEAGVGAAADADVMVDDISKAIRRRIMMMMMMRRRRRRRRRTRMSWWMISPRPSGEQEEEGGRRRMEEEDDDGEEEEGEERTAFDDVAS
eukprot:1756502-Rhodomonas_salina.1